MSWAVWITGPPGSGKTALARATAAALEGRGTAVKILELDEIRRVLTPCPASTDAEHEVVHRALVYTARLLTEAGVPVLIDATGHRRAWRELARELLPAFAEVELRCPPEICRQRAERRRGGPTPGGARAGVTRPGETAPGLEVPYEPATAPDLALDTAACDRWTQVQAVVYLAERLAREAAAGALPVAPGSVARA